MVLSLLAGLAGLAALAAPGGSAAPGRARRLALGRAIGLVLGLAAALGLAAGVAPGPAAPSARAASAPPARAVSAPPARAASAPSARAASAPPARAASVPPARAVSAPSARAATAPGLMWLVDAHAVSLLHGAGAGGALLARAFGGGYVSGPPGGLGIPTATYYSYAAISGAYADGALPGGYRAVLLDMEHWPLTPPAEQAQPARYERLAAGLVHAYGMLLIDAPAVDIVQARCTCASGPSQRRHYLAWDIAGGAARYADVIDIQAQNDERDLPGYQDFVAAAAQAAQAAHPGVAVLAGLSTDNGSQEVGGGQLQAAYRDVSGLVAGFWLNIPAKSAACPDCAGPYPGPALSLLRRIYG